LQLLTSIPGIGKITAITLLSEIEDIRRFQNLDKLCSYVGLIPTMSSSGERDSAGSITSRSNNFLRSMLVESAWIAIKYDPSLALAYVNLSKRMKKNEAIVRIAKKLLGRIRYVLKNEKEYVCNIV
jgi:transposase